MSAETLIGARTVEDLAVDARAVNLETVDCNFCGGSKYSPYDSVGEWRIVKCDRCGFCFTNPRPTVESLPSFYDLNYFRDEDVKRFGYSPQDSTKVSEDIEYYQRIMDIESRLEKRGSLLEVGAAYGSFLGAMRTRGWSVNGVEVSREAVEIARKRQAVDIFCGQLESFETKGGYDVVCMYHSLEHTPDAAYVIRRSYELLNPGGIIVIEVPNLSGFDAKINKTRRLLSYDLPRHLNHFTPAVLAKKLEQTRFKVLGVDRYYPDFILRFAAARASRPGKAGTPEVHLDKRGDVVLERSDAPRMASEVSSWKTRLLKSVSRFFPGWRFTIVARK